MVDDNGPLDDTVREVLGVAQGTLDEFGFYAERRIEAGPMRGHWLALEPMTFARVRIGVSARATSADGQGEARRGYIYSAFAEGFVDVWEFPDMATARQAFDTWNGAWTTDKTSEPAGWSRHPLTSRRRDPKTGEIRVRRTEIPDDLFAELRTLIAEGKATHECDEWRIEFVDRCALCDRAFPPPAPVSIDTAAANGDPIARFLQRGLAAQQAVDRTLENGVSLREATDDEQLEALAKAARERGLTLADDERVRVFTVKRPKADDDGSA